MTWQPTTTLAMLHYRAELLRKLRQFFAERQVLEVETPLLSQATVTDPHLHSFQTRYYSDKPDGQQTFYLQTSPEFAMKRLLAAGSGPIYQISKAFRNQGESGRYHNPEFSLLEWYRPGYDHHRLMNEVEDLLKYLLDCDIVQRWSYAEVFQRYLNVDAHQVVIADLKPILASFDVSAERLGLKTLADHLNFLMAHVIEPKLPQQLVFIYDYPVSLAALAKVSHDTRPVAERFEVYFHGIELANGFHELADANEQRRRFEYDLSSRAQQGYPSVPIDENLLAALANGFPDCAGVALGIDRLLMLMSKHNKLTDVINFPFDRS